LNINSKTDKEDRSFDDIAFLSEIVADFRFGKITQCLKTSNLGLLITDITNFNNPVNMTMISTFVAYGNEASYNQYCRSFFIYVV
jgi:hypothetical protein